MALEASEQKARREAGRREHLEKLTVPQIVQRHFTNGRPPASELTTPTGAAIASVTLWRAIGTKIADLTNGQGLRPNSFAVSVGFASPDLTVIGFTPLLIGYAPGPGPEYDAPVERMLAGNIPLGVIFGIADEGRILMGARPFLVTKLVDVFLGSLMETVQKEIELDGLFRQ